MDKGTKFYDVKISKIDISIDMQGSFIPRMMIISKPWLKSLLQGTINSILSNNDTNFLSLRPVRGLKLVIGDNWLFTCYQYGVQDGCGNKFMNIKLYDKTLELLSRDGE